MAVLAEINTIKEFKKIEGKDKIVFATFNENGYEVICDKSFEIGEKILRVSVDTVLPEKSEFEFLRTRCYSVKWGGFVIRTLKMGPAISQGIMYHLDDIKYVNIKKEKAGKDVSEILGIIKYDPELRKELNESKKYNKFQIFLLKNKFTGKFFRWFFIGRKQVKKSGYLKFVSKAGETNVQDFNDFILKREMKDFYVSEKVEGKNALYAVEKNKKGKYDFYYCSHNVVFKDGTESKNGGDYLRFANENNLKEKMIKWATEQELQTFAISGELCGPGIQKNIYGFDKLKFFMFDSFVDGVLQDRKWHNIVASTLGIETVPILKSYNESDFTDELFTVEFWKNQAKGKSVIGSCPKLREGIVVRNYDQLFGFKSKCKEYALAFNSKEQQEEE